MADETDSDSKKRVVKNPETFRERALSASVEREKPAKQHRVRKFFAFIFRPFVIFFTRLFRIQPFKTIGWIAKQIGRVIFPKYIRTALKELKLVSWPNWKLSRRLTYAVLVFAVIFGASVASVDYGLDKLFKIILLK